MRQVCHERVVSVSKNVGRRASHFVFSTENAEKVFPFVREKVARLFQQFFPFVRIPISSRAYCSPLKKEMLIYNGCLQYLQFRPNTEYLVQHCIYDYIILKVYSMNKVLH